ncbi:MAG: ABC transporter substrate-binding protein, partial [Bacteroidales bacterium]|nr:ABC transporter substrate-binding protein [Bacteroidales bacterium]
MAYFKAEDSLFDITEKYPQTIKVFVEQGFEQLADEEKRATLGKALRLNSALSMRNIDEAAFAELLNQAIEGTNGDNLAVDPAKKINIRGLLPCPVRLPLQEALDEFIENNTDDIHIKAQLKAASMGLDWIKDEVLSAAHVDSLDELYISAGFDMFFEDSYFGRFIKSGEYADPLLWKRINSDFDHDGLRLKDPKSRYGILAVVPAVFLVNTQIIGDRPMPQS